MSEKPDNAEIREPKEKWRVVAIYLNQEQAGLLDQIIDKREYMNPTQFVRKKLYEEADARGLEYDKGGRAGKRNTDDVAKTD